MSKKTTALTMLGGAAVGATLLMAAPTAGADPNTGPFSPNWGQEVKACNASSCYPGGTKRGEYVREQARDGDGPGYGREIHDLATPGNSAGHSAVGTPGGPGDGGTGGGSGGTGGGGAG